MKSLLVRRIIPWSKAELQRAFHYNPETGEFLRRGGFLPPRVNREGYLVLAIERKNYLVHRLIWKWMTGEDPAPDLSIDHKNREKADNRWSNLRLATMQQNKWNSPAKTLLPNIRHSASQYWHVLIQIGVGKVYRNRHEFLEDALADARQVRIQYHGEFALDLNGWETPTLEQLIEEFGDKTYIPRDSWCNAGRV